MNGIKKMTARWLLAVCTMATMGCSEDTPEPVLPTDEWNVFLTRSTAEEITVALRYDETVSYARLISSTDASQPAKWVGDKPTWPEDNTTPVEVITFAPAVEELPTTVDATKNIAYTMDYTTATTDDKPQTFTLQHLMSQLEVHIKISDDEKHHYMPSDAVIGLCTTATVYYPNKCLKEPSTKNDAFSLGTFTKEGGDESEENWVNTAQIVIPQTLEAGKPCLTFKAGDKTYTYTPEENIVLKAGKKTKLYLGVAYENDYVTLGGINVTDWADGGTIDAGEAEESTEK